VRNGPTYDNSGFTSVKLAPSTECACPFRDTLFWQCIKFDGVGRFDEDAVFDKEDTSHNLLGNPFKALLWNEYGRSLAGYLWPPIAQAWKNAVIGNLMTLQSLCENPFSPAKTMLGIASIARSSGFQRTECLLDNARRSGVMRVETESYLDEQLLFELAVIGVARDTTRHMPSLKIGRRRIRIP
jgi:hypothetical protein